MVTVLTFITLKMISMVRVEKPSGVRTKEGMGVIVAGSLPLNLSNQEASLWLISLGLIRNLRARSASMLLSHEVLRWSSVIWLEGTKLLNRALASNGKLLICCQKLADSAFADK